VKETAVVVLNFNGRKLLEVYLPSVVKHSSADADVVVIDNNSSDESVLFLSENYPQVQIIQLDTNSGYAGGYNQGLKFLNYKYYILLNSDVEVTSKWISPIIRIFKENPNVGCVQPKILDYKKKHLFEYAGSAGGYLDKDGFPFCRGRLLMHIESDTGQYDERAEVFWASGAALFISHEAFHRVNGFDEDFFAHMEEIDLCWRLQNVGYTHYCEPSSTVYHLGGGTLNQQSSHKTYLNFRNNLFIITKNYSGSLFIKIFYRMALDGVAAWRFLFRGEVSNFIAVAKAHLFYYLALPSLLRKRKSLAKKPFSELKGMTSKSLIQSFFLKKKHTFSELMEE